MRIIYFTTSTFLDFGRLDVADNLTIPNSAVAIGGFALGFTVANNIRLEMVKKRQQNILIHSLKIII